MNYGQFHERPRACEKKTRNGMRGPNLGLQIGIILMNSSNEGQ